MIKILNNSLILEANIKNLLNPWRFEEINSENKLDFTAILTDKVSNYVNENYVAEFNDDYFDIAYYSKDMNEDGTCTMAVECEHISYRLNNPEYYLDYFTYTGTPTFILGKVLEGTGFTIGTVEFNEILTYSAQEKKSRRAILMELVTLLGGEVLFNKFSVSILNRRGSTDLRIFTKGKNIKVISKVYNGREDIPVVSYTCAPIVLPNKPIGLGDNVLLIQPELGIQDTFRIVRYGYDPVDNMLAEIEVANYINGLEDQFYRFETNTLTKGKSYYGARISPENGFESIRSDKKARTVMNADEFAMQSGDGSGNNWTNKLYFDPELGKYVFDGTLSATMIEALEAQFDITISNTVITQTLAAETGTIAQLTVDQVETSTKVQNYLVSNKADVNYIKIFEQYIQLVTASTNGTATEQAKDRRGSKLYWTDNTRKGTTTDVTNYPVLIYVYEELVKAEIAFVLDGGNYVPKITLGTGDGVTDNSAKAEILKGDTGLEINYYASNTGELRQIKLANDGVFINGLRYELTALNIGSDGFQASYGDVVQNATLTKDVTGKITAITSGGATIPITYNEV